jgi:NF-X1-type zinc finger protein NFXL1
MVTISCACGETHFEVPCGTETNQKPPRCRKLCHITPLCRHGQNQKPHKCHYGACPPCRLLCDEEYPCGHKCKLRFLMLVSFSSIFFPTLIISLLINIGFCVLLMT